LFDEKSTFTEEQVELAVDLVQKIGDDVLWLGNLELYAPIEMIVWRLSVIFSMMIYHG